MLNKDMKQVTEEEKIDVREFAEMARKLPDKEKERFFYMMKGVELVSETAKTAKAAV
jgi:hypothetical protein